ncbi:MAG: acyltransferase [Acidobacteria bacterium]|nr:acyltransferase [Acidobacteriota bacterium]
MTRSYRVPQIEYLRAIAVVAVILDHLDVLPSGFLGVDIFFVISGFVISQALWEGDRGSFVSSLKHFYYRRIIRIIPPLAVVTVASFLLGWFLFFDQEFVRLQRAISHQSLFLQNIYFVETVTDYFRGIPSTTLTLHTWSLAVEEQFYLIYPCLFLLLFRSGRILKAIAIPLMVSLTGAAVYFAIFNYDRLETATVSFLGQFLVGEIDSSPARFYSISFRAWEFLFGWAAFALKPHVPGDWAGGTWRRVVFLIGFSLLCAMTLVEVEVPTWPNLYTVGCCLLTALCLVATPAAQAQGTHLSPVGRFGVYVGNTSYSAYLWHWPLLGYFVYTNIDFGARAWDYLAFLCSLAVLVVITYHTVEKNRFRITPAYSVLLLLGFMAGTYGLSVATRDYGWFSPAKQRIFETSQYDQSACGNYDLATVTRRFVVLFGESHAQAVRTEFQKVANEHGFDVLCVAGSRLRLGVSRGETERDLARVASARGYAGIAMVMRWNSYAFGYPPYEVEESGNRFLSLGDVQPRNAQEAETFFKLNVGHLFKTISAAAPSGDIGFMLQVPQNPFFAHKEALMDFHGLRFRSLPPKPASQYVEESARMRRVLAEITADVPSRVSILDPARYFCVGRNCAYRHEWSVLYKDDDHLSVYGETVLGPLFDEWFKTIGKVENRLQDPGRIIGRPLTP